MAAALRPSTLRALESAKFLLTGDRKRCSIPLCFQNVHRTRNDLRNNYCSFINHAAASTPLATVDYRCLFTSSRRHQHRQENENVPSNKPKARLMDFPEILWPNFFKSIKNYILTFLVIKPYLDNEFSLEEFMRGAKQAINLVSKAIAQQKLEELEGLVTADALAEIKANLAKYTELKNKELYIQNEDMFFAFPYQIGIMFDESAAIPTRFVEITVCFHCYPDFVTMKKNDPAMKDMFDHKDKIVICNYRFIREYTKTMHGNWMINKLNHFRAAET